MVNNKTTNSLTARNYLFHVYKYQSKCREIEFSLTQDQFYTLTKENCWYCGIIPSQVVKHKNHGVVYSCIYNGIDRVDSNKGYLISNCISCCKACNKMKSTISCHTFLQHVKAIANNLELV